ncbi:MAG: hypothetical protein II984_04230, partial [Clostridia bacterium]|nr:hypothetical protein [Clostridia bacterium]
MITPIAISSEIIPLIVSAVVLVRYLIYPIAIVINSLILSQSSSSMGIIGGADGPTAVMIASSLRGGGIFYLIMSISGVIVFIASIVYL